MRLKVNDITIHFKRQAEGSSYADVGTIDSHFRLLAHHVDGVGKKIPRFWVTSERRGSEWQPEAGDGRGGGR